MLGGPHGLTDDVDALREHDPPRGEGHANQAGHTLSLTRISFAVGLRASLVRKLA